MVACLIEGRDIEFRPEFPCACFDPKAPRVETRRGLGGGGEIRRVPYSSHLVPREQRDTTTPPRPKGSDLWR